LPDPVRAIEAMRIKSATVCVDRARLGVAMRHLYMAAGFEAVVAATHGCLQELAEQVREEAGDTALGGWQP
jgi:hypothetical protein